MSPIGKYRLFGETVETVGEVLMAAVARSVNPTSEWHEHRVALYNVVQALPLAAFDTKARRTLARLGITNESPPSSDLSKEPATTSEAEPSADDNHTGANESATETGEVAVGSRRFVPVPKLSTKCRKAFRCQSCRFAWVERVSALTKRNQRKRSCLCETLVLPHKRFFTRSAKIDLKNIQTLLTRMGVGHWRVVTSVDEFKNSRIVIRLEHRHTGAVQTVVLRPLIAGETKLS